MDSQKKRANFYGHVSWASFRSLLGLTFVCMTAGPLYAQFSTTTGVLVVSVADMSDAVVPKSAVTLSSFDREWSKMSETDSHGTAFFYALAPGEYEVSVARGQLAPGTARVEIQAGHSTVLNLRLRPATVHESVVVHAVIADEPFQTDLSLQEVRESSAKDVGEAISQLTGLWKIRKGGIANDVVLRGFQQDNLKVLVDGDRVYGACPNHMDPAAFHVDYAEVDRVEVVKGPFDLTGQGSLGGSINIVRKKALPGLHLTPGLGVGSFGFWNPSVSASYRGSALSFLGGYSRRIADAYKDGRGVRFTDRSNYRQDAGNTRAFDVGTGWLTFDAAPFDRHSLEIAYARQQGGTTLYPYLQMDALLDNSDRAHLKYAIRDVSPAVRSIRLQGYFSGVRHWMTDELRLSAAGALTNFGMSTFATTRVFGGNAEVALKNFVFGFESYLHYWDAVNSMRRPGMITDQPAIPGVGTNVTGLYADYNGQLTERLRMGGSLRIDRAAMEAAASGINTNLYVAYSYTARLAQVDANPSGSIRLAYTLPKQVEISLAAGSTVRIPTAVERYFNLKRTGTDWVGNPGLRPVRNTELDLGLNIRASRFSLGPRIFYSDLRDYITIHGQSRLQMLPGVMNSNARSYDNINARIYGAELDYRFLLTGSVTLSGGLSFTQGSRDARPSSGIRSTNLAEMPPMKSRTSLRYSRNKIFLEVEGIASVAQRRVDTDLLEQPTPGYGVLNTKGGFQTTRLVLALGIDNVGNRYYVEHLSSQRDPYRMGTRVPEPGRSLFLNACYKF